MANLKDMQRNVCSSSERKTERERERRVERGEFGDNGTDQFLCLKRNRGAFFFRFLSFFSNKIFWFFFSSKRGKIGTLNFDLDKLV